MNVKQKLKKTQHAFKVSYKFLLSFLINTNRYVTLMPLKALEACESHLYKAACVFYRARKKEQRMSRTFLWLHLNTPPPPNMQSYTGGELVHGTSLFLRA